MKFTIITLFPEMFEQVLGTSMMWKAQEKKLAEFELVNLRDFGLGPRHQVDDTPYGGGDGMLLRPEPIFAAVESVKEQSPTAETILMTPKGLLWSQELARKFAGQNLQTRTIDNTQKAQQAVSGTLKTWPDGLPANYRNKNHNSVIPDAENLCQKLPAGLSVDAEKKVSSRTSCHYILICPHYEGYDERILELVDHQISIGHYILTGGELPAMIVIDSIVRLIPGVLGGETSAEIESFSDGTNLEYPQYTRPENFRGMKVPDVLLSGHHGEISKWREAQSGSITPTL